MPEHVQRGGLRSPPQPYSSCPNFRAEDSSTLESDGSFRGPSGRLLHTKPSLRSAVKRQERPGVQQTASKGYLIHRWGGRHCACAAGMRAGELTAYQLRALDCLQLEAYACAAAVCQHGT